MAEKTFGIENSIDVILFISELAKTFREANQDGSINVLDAVKAIRILPSLAEALSGSDQIKDELMDLNGEEKDVLLLALKTAIHDLIDAVA
jgi:hypothetical protein